LYVLPDVASLQLLFSQLNFHYFAGEIPGYRIAYNTRLRNVAGRITYKPPLIELSRKHFERRPDALRETLLHEMIHAWLHARKEDSGHGSAFKKKMRELGLTSIYHDLGTVPPRTESAKRYILRCDQCTLELLRKRLPPANVSCGRCSPRRFDARFPMRVYEVLGAREVPSAAKTAANRGAPRGPKS
jgi:predicted SprT family Zn-dependent metalloprotease